MQFHTKAASDFQRTVLIRGRCVALRARIGVCVTEETDEEQMPIWM